MAKAQRLSINEDKVYPLQVRLSANNRMDWVTWPASQNMQGLRHGPDDARAPPYVAGLD